MPITAKGTIKHGMIKLPDSLKLPEGTKVLVSIQLVKSNEERKQIARELAGSWRGDNNLKTIFEEIDVDRHSYFGRELEPIK